MEKEKPTMIAHSEYGLSKTSKEIYVLRMIISSFLCQKITSNAPFPTKNEAL